MNTIYKLYCKDENIKEFYIGSSTNFKSRKNKHKSDCNNENGRSYNIKVYKFIRANGGFQNFDFEILLETDEDDIKKLEQKYIDELKPTLNCFRACGFDSKEYGKQYRLKNKQKIKEYERLYRLKNTERQMKNRAENKEKMKEYNKLYYLKKNIKIKEYQKQYNKENKKKIKEYQRLRYLKKKLIHNDLKN